MSRWYKFLAKTVVASVVLVAVGAAAAVAGVVILSQITGTGPKELVKSAASSVLPGAGQGNHDIGRMTESIISLRGEFSTAFSELETRVQRLEQNPGGDGRLLQPQKIGGIIKAHLPPPPSGKLPPPARFGGAISESQMIATPQSKIPEFNYTPPAKADVCPKGCKYRSLYLAYQDAKEGDTITLAPGYYPECLEAKKSLLIAGQIGPNGERAEFDSQCKGKGAFIIKADKFELRGVLVRNITAGHRNGACVRIEPASGTVRFNNIICINSQNGILGGATGAIFVDSSLFIQNGARGLAHGLYINIGKELIVRNTIIHSSKDNGHSLKAGVERLYVQDSILAALNGKNSRALDFYGGGTLVVTGSVLQQGPNSSNHDFIGLAHEHKRLNYSADHIALFEDNWFIYDAKPNRCCRWLATGRKLGPVIFRNNRFVSLTEPHMDDVVLDSNRDFKTRKEAGLPAYNGELSSLPHPEHWKGWKK